MSTEEPFHYYWNSNTRVNAPVRIIGVYDDNYAVESRGHVYVVPKGNITTQQKVFDPPAPVATTAPKPEMPYLVALTKEQLQYLQMQTFASPWSLISSETLFQCHSQTYTIEWFWISFATGQAILLRYNYDTYKTRKNISHCLPGGELGMLTCQLWEEQLRRDGIVPK
jgi:hypothetical protein